MSDVNSLIDKIHREQTNGMRVAFKNEWELEHLERIHPNLFYLLGCIVKFAYDRSLPVTITSIIRPRLPVSVSDSHGDGRALDLSVRGWSVDHCLEAVDYFKKNFAHIGAISAKTGEPNPLVYEPTAKYGAHLHLQCRP
jgi:hypothetical protein